MNPNNALKANEEPLSVNIRNERNSLITMLAEGRRLDKRRNESNKNRDCTKLYPPMDTNFQYRPIRNWERRNRDSLDTTFHTTSHTLEEALSFPFFDSIDCHHHDSENELYIAKGKFTAKLINSFNHQFYTSVDISNVTSMDNNIDQCNAYLLCFNISKKSAQLQSLCLHNCKIDDTCVEALVSMLTSKGNMLKSLNLSKNIITDVGAMRLLDAMKSHHCIVEELDLSQNQLTLSGVFSFSESLSTLLHLKVLRLADSEHLVPLSVYQQFAKAIEKNVVVHTLTLGSEIMDFTQNEANDNHIVEKKQRIDDALLSFCHEPMFTAVTDHIRMMLQQNYIGIGKLMRNSRIDVAAIRDILDTVKPDRKLDACFRLLRLKPDILLAIVN